MLPWKQLKHAAFLDFSARSHSDSSSLPKCSAELIIRHSANASRISPPPLQSSGDEVGLWDDALHFVISWVCCRLIVTDGHFMSVSLTENKAEEMFGNSVS
ncbi:hypothetical protein CHARACLAT_023775 [Characodon lateralis]|uniref:Uncharacterized protein n=1 Tax=Characodon lateralis TaxID=208331 RepID=A0ABU7DUC2_9TELE|nr:hypothetical protein [Characodon lateralis]